MSSVDRSRQGAQVPGLERAPLEKDPLERAEKALDAANTAAVTVRNLYITFLLLGTYIGVIIASTTDEQLLRVSSVTLPLLDVELPILGFYIFVPWLFVLFHFNLLYQFTLLGRKLRVFDRLAAQLPEADDTALRERLVNFPLVHLLSGPPQDRFMRWMSILIVGITLIVLPLLLLLGAQIRFLAFQDSVITWWQRAAVVFDAVLLVLFWGRIISSLGAWAWWWQRLRRVYSFSIWLLTWPWVVIRSIWKRHWIPSTRRALGHHGQISIGSGAGLLIVAVLITIFVSLTVATVREGHWEKKVLTYMPESWTISVEIRTPAPQPPPKRVVFWLTYVLFEAEDAFVHRHLDLREKVLTNNELSPETISVLRKGEPEQQAEALLKVRRIILKNRNLRGANLNQAILPKADLRKVDLRGANLESAQLREADLRSVTDLREIRPLPRITDLLETPPLFQLRRITNLQGAVLSGANLQGTVLSWTNLQGTVLSKANIQGAYLNGADLQGAYLNGADLQRADLFRALLHGTDLGETQLQGTDLRSANLQGAILRGAQLQGADLLRANLQGAVLDEANLQGVVLDEAQLQGADLLRANLQGAVLREAFIGGANFKDAHLDLADLRNLDRDVLTEEQYLKISEDLELEVDDAERRAEILDRIKAVIGRKDTLKQAIEPEEDKPCLSDTPKPFVNCLTEDQSDQYNEALVPYLVEELTCVYPHAALGVAKRTILDERADLAVALLKAGCAAVKELPEYYKKRLREIAERFSEGFEGVQPPPTLKDQDIKDLYLPQSVSTSLELDSLLGFDGSNYDLEKVKQMKEECWPIAGVPPNTTFLDFMQDSQFSEGRVIVRNCMAGL